MPPEAAGSSRRRWATIDIAIVSLAMVLFGLFSHRGPPWAVLSVIGLSVAALTIGSSLRAVARPSDLLALGSPGRGTILFALAGAAFGCGAGMLHRVGMGNSPWPVAAATLFAPLACLIGATEELVYRGWLQGRAMVFGAPAAIAIGALAHTAYKTALFVLPSAPGPTDLLAAGAWTFAGGLVFGGLRQASGSLIPALLAHAAFDFVVYGALPRAPWWVWS